MLATKNLVRGNRCYNERLVQLNGEEYRIWKHYRSKLAAGIIHGLEILPIIEKSRILYLGASQGITVSHVSDMIGTEGIIYAVEHSHETAKKLQEEVTSKRKNIKPIIMDAAKPSQYQIIDKKVDVVYVDIAQPDQTEIAIENCRLYLKSGGYIFLVIKTRSIDVVKDPRSVIKEEIKKLETLFQIKQTIDLHPYDKDHAMVIATSLG